MFVGHYAGAFVAKAVEPRLSLATYAVAVQLVDVAWGVLVLAGVERAALDPTLPSNPLVLSYMPYTHSLPATFVWMGIAGLCGTASAGSRAGIVLALAVGSHWLGDLLVHRPDLPLGWTGPRVGLALWDHAFVSWLVEIGVVLASVWWCARNGVVMPARALWRLGLALALLETATRIVPPPRSTTVMVVAALAGYVSIAGVAARVEASARGGSH